MRIVRRLTAFILVLLLLVGVLQSYALAAGYTTLELGDAGNEVKNMQAALVTLGYLADNADGKFGAKTLAAIKSFQGRNGLKTDGKAGNLTLTTLYNLAGSGNSTITGTNGSLIYGSSGSAVQNMQVALTSLGYSTGGTDGKFGNATLKAVKAFQQASKLAVDGKAGTSTLTKLYELAGSGSSTTSGSSAVCTSATLSHTLRLNHTGTDVSQVQAKLVELNYLQGVSGTYDNATVTAVKAFQSRNNQTADGLAGTKTFKALLSSTAVAAVKASGSNGASTAYATLRSGTSGDEVRTLQTQLTSLDYNVEVTGNYDSQTTQAVKSFQTRNKLTADGVAGVKTQTLLYSGNALKYSAQSAAYDVPSVGKIKLLHWFNDVKPALKGKSSIYVYDPASGYSYTLHLYSLGRHADVEPQTSEDTANMMAAFGGKAIWDPPKFVYVRLPSGTWTVATMHNVAHGGQSIKDNNFEGQNCVHFLRDMEEVSKNDPDYGVKNQKALRKGWQQLTGEVVE